MQLTGDAKYQSGKLVANLGMNGEIAMLSSTLDYTASPNSVKLSTAAFMEGKYVALPDFNLNASGKVDLAAAGKCIPGLLQLREDMQITAGAIELPELVVKGGEKPSARGSLKAYATIRKGSVSKALDPIEVAFKLLPDADDKIRLDQANVKSSFADVQASGTIDQLDATVTADLDAAKRQFAELFDLDKVILSGRLAATLKALKRSPADKRIELSLTVNTDRVKVGQATPQAAHTPAAGEEPRGHGPAAITGQVLWHGTMEPAAQKLSLVGSLEIPKLAISEYGDLFPGDRPSVTLELTMDFGQQRLDVSKFVLACKLLSLDISGKITKLETERILDLRGKYSASCAELSALAKRLAPEAGKTMAMVGKSEGDIRITGPAAKPEIRPEFRQMQASTAMGWGEGSRVYGLTFGQAKLEPSLADAMVKVPTAAIPANGGALRLGGLVDMRGKEPMLKIPGKLDMLENVSLNAELGREILSRVLPLLAQTNKLEGKVSLYVRDVAVPLGEQIKKTGEGSGRMDLSGVRLSPSGETARLFELLGLPANKPYPVKASPVDFRLKDGGLEYENFTLTFADKFDVKLFGSVKFDDSVNLILSVPVTPGLLGAVGVKGPTSEYVRVLEGIRIEIPLVGTRQRPRMDLSKVDVKALIQQAVKKLGLPGIDLLPELLWPKEKKSMTAPPKTPATKPGLLDLLTS